MKQLWFKRRGLRLIGVLMALCVLFSLAGCTSGNGGTSDPESSSGSSSGDTTTSGGDTVATTDTTGGTSSAISGSGTTTSGTGKPSSTTVKPTVDTTGGSSNQASKPTIPADLGSGTTYYVSSSTGNDSNDGRSPEKAFKTVDKVNKLALQPGDNILFKRGDVFKGAHLEPTGSGQAADGKWITLDAYGSGEAPMFKDASKNKAAISLSPLITARGYRIRNLTIDNYLAGIVFKKAGMKVAFDGLLIEDVTIRNITTGKPYGEGGSFPEGLDTGYGLYMGHVKNATIRNVSIITTDIPVRMYGELTLFDKLYTYDSRVTGVMLYGAPYGSNYDTVMASAGGITVQNSRVIHTGTSGLKVGTTGFMIQYTKNCVIKDSEVAYTTNGTGDNDGCALDWEELNIDCTIQNVYAHDNDGPFLLAMEHPESIGRSTGNKVIDCLSVNNGKRDHTAGASFIDHSGYPNVSQRLTVQNCIDIGMPGSVPYSYWASFKEPLAKFDSKYVTSKNFTSGLMNVYATFDDGSLEAFGTKTGASVKNSHLSLSAGGKVRTNYSASDYVVSSWLKGKAELVFMATGTDKGYTWKFEDGKVIAQKVSGGKATTIKTVKVSDLDVDGWYRGRVEVSGGTIKTYVNDLLVDTLKDSTYTSGSAGINAVGAAQADEFFVYRYVAAPREVQSYDKSNAASGGKLNFSSSNGAYDEPEVKWTASGAYTWVYRAHGTGRLTLNGKSAYIERKDMEVKVDGLLKEYNTIKLVLTNATSSAKLYIDFTTDGGKTWHTKAFTVKAMSSDNQYPFKALWPEFTEYTVDMSDMDAWKGTINGFRVRTDATSGFISFKSVLITK